MATQIETLVRMLNQISANLSAYPTDEAAMRAAEHMQRFWAPQMRQQLIDEAEQEELSLISKMAVEKLLEVMPRKAS
ncbi:formate dehydrogenase subunit delta [Methylophaga lonarensis]|uniref:formate dehydrogenase subunit delta n=1 Tax=Methylophaga lonarensis TaxID=999151 RepID=UPI003D286F5F